MLSLFPLLSTGLVLTACLERNGMQYVLHEVEGRQGMNGGRTRIPEYHSPRSGHCSPLFSSCRWRLWPSENPADGTSSPTSCHIVSAAIPSSSSWHPPWPAVHTLTETFAMHSIWHYPQSQSTHHSSGPQWGGRSLPVGEVCSDALSADWNPQLLSGTPTNNHNIIFQHFVVRKKCY